MKADLIHAEISRCNNYKCPTNCFCARFMQRQIDRLNPDRAMFLIEKFNGDEKNVLCDYFLNADVIKKELELQKINDHAND